jgi:hypothetical protein
MNRAKSKPATQTIPKVWNASDFCKFIWLSSVATAFIFLLRLLKLTFYHRGYEGYEGHEVHEEDEEVNELVTAS